MKQVSFRPNKFFSPTSIGDVTCTNELHSKPACYIHLPTSVIYSRLGPGTVWWRGGEGGVGPVCLNFSVLPSPAERNCVIMPDSFYDSNQGYCLCKRPTPHCAAEQPRHYTQAAENESTAIGCGGAGWKSITQYIGYGENGAVCCLPLCYRVNTIHSLCANYQL